jgi:hypothetical protein
MVFDVSIRFSGTGSRLSLEELWTLLYAQLSVLDISEQVAARLLSLGEYGTGDLAIWLMSLREDLAAVVDLADSRAVAGASTRNEISIFSTLPLDDEGQRAGSPLNRPKIAKSRLVAHMLDELFKAANRRGYARRLSSAISDREACAARN